MKKTVFYILEAFRDSFLLGLKGFVLMSTAVMLLFLPAGMSLLGDMPTHMDIDVVSTLNTVDGIREVYIMLVFRLPPALIAISVVVMLMLRILPYETPSFIDVKGTFLSRLILVAFLATWFFLGERMNMGIFFSAFVIVGCVSGLICQIKNSEAKRENDEKEKGEKNDYK